MLRSVFTHTKISLQRNIFFPLSCETLFKTQYKMSSTGEGRPVVLITRRIPTSGLEILSKRCEVRQWDSDMPPSREEMLKQIKGVDALFCLLTDKIDGALLDAAGSRLKAIGTMSVGYDHIDLDACQSRKIPVGFTPDVLTDATAELTVALLLATSRRILEGVKAVKDGLWGTWKPTWLCGPGLHHSTVGIIGLGRIGMAVGKRLQPFGVQRFLYSGLENKCADKLNAEMVSIDDLLTHSDFVIVCCALTPETKGLLNAAAFRKMKNTAIMVNTSRGPVVNEDDLYDALKSGEIRAAGLDVTNPEPLAINSPLLTLKNCIILPHIGSATEEARSMMSELTAQNIVAVLDGHDMPSKIQGT